jgi:FkbM family methyltransferase
MGFRSAIISRYFRCVDSPLDWPACFVLAVGVAALEPAKITRKWPSRVLPRTVTLKFKRFADQPVSINPGNWTHHAVLREFIFEDAYDLDRVPFVPSRIIDCGAHIGLFLRLCRQRFPSVAITAFEPQAANARLARSVLPAGLLELHEAAVGAHDGQVVFDDGALSGFGHVAQGNAEASEKAHRVPLVSLPRILSSIGDRLLLKMDIEGAERELLPKIASLLPQNCAIFLETHHHEAGWDAAQSLLVGLGFRAEKLRNGGECIDGFFVRTSPAVS